MENKKVGKGSRPSKREHAPKGCKKASCKVMFIPTNRRQEYCTEQHRIDHNNDLRDTRAEPMRLLGKKLNHNESILAKIFAMSLINEHTEFSLELLQFEEYNFGLCTERTINTNTTNEIEWVFDFGLEGFDAEKKSFIIHSR